MPIVFIAIGALFLIAAVRGTITDKDGQPGLLTLLKSDFVSTQAQGNFLIWMVSLFVIGALGYIPGFKPIANALLFLIVLVLVLSNSKGKAGGGIFAEFNAALTSSGASNPVHGIATVNTPPVPALPALPAIGSNFLPGGTFAVPGFNGVGTIGG